MINHETRQPLHRLIDLLPEDEIHTAFRFLEFLAGVRQGDIEDDMTDEEKAESEENWQAILRGEGIPWDEVKKELADE